MSFRHKSVFCGERQEPSLCREEGAGIFRTIALQSALSIAIVTTFAPQGHAMAALRDFTPTPEQISKCTADAIRLCPDDLTDRNKLEQCMVRANRRHRLSAECGAVFK